MKYIRKPFFFFVEKKIIAITQSFSENSGKMKRTISLLSAVKGKRRKFGPGEFNFPFSAGDGINVYVHVYVAVAGRSTRHFFPPQFNQEEEQ